MHSYQVSVKIISFDGEEEWWGKLDFVSAFALTPGMGLGSHSGLIIESITLESAGTHSIVSVNCYDVRAVKPIEEKKQQITAWTSELARLRNWIWEKQKG